MRFGSILLILFLSNGSFAQTSGSVAGRVFDIETNAPLVGVNVQIPGLGKGAATDSLGKFRIGSLPPGTYRLQFNYIGYEPAVRTDIIVSSARPEYLTIGMQQVYLEYGSVTVRPRYFTEDLKSAVSSTQLSREEIRRFPGGFEDVVRTVATLPGVSVVNEGGRNDLLVRGGGPTENLYLINGIEVPNINHFGNQGSTSGALSFVNLDFIDRVEFSTGGFSARYGNKMSSVLAIDLRPGRQDRFGGKATISATQFGLDFEGPVTKKGNFLFSARKSYLDLIFKAVGQPFVPVYTDFNFLLNYDITRNDKVTLLGLVALDRIDRDQGTNENRIKNSDLLDNTQNQVVSGIRYQRLFKNAYIEAIANFNFNRFRLSQVDSVQTEFFNSKADETEFNLKLNAFFNLSFSSSLSLGLSKKQIYNKNSTTFADSIYNRSGQRVPFSDLSLPKRRDVDQNVNQYVGYVEWEQELGGNLKIKLGLREDYLSFLDRSFYHSWRFAALYQISNRLTLKASSGRYFQSPSYVWITNSFNQKLKALRNDMVVLGFDYLLRDDTNITFEAYAKHYRDLPTGTSPQVTDYLVLTNSGVGYGGSEEDFQSFGYFDLVSKAKGQAYGLELSIQKKYSEIPLYGQLSLGYSKSEFTAFNEIKYPGQFDQRFIFNVTGGYKFNEKWEINGKFRYFTGSPFTPVYRPSTNNGFIQNLPDEYLSSRLNAGHHLDLRIDRRFNFSSWAMILFLDIQNIYNNRNQVRPRYEAWEDQVEDTNAIGILPSIGFSAEW